MNAPGFVTMPTPSMAYAAGENANAAITVAASRALILALVIDPNIADPTIKGSIIELNRARLSRSPAAERQLRPKRLKRRDNPVTLAKITQLPGGDSLRSAYGLRRTALLADVRNWHFETCRPASPMSVHGGRLEVTGASSNRRE
jgi:hypothetical protein